MLRHTLAFGLALLAWTVAPAMARTVAETAIPARAEAAAASTDWWDQFNDSGLDAFMARLGRDNTALAAAAARLAGARAQAALARADAAPQLGLAQSANYAGGPLINAAGGSGGLFTAALGASWEPDLLGRLAPSRAAGRAEIRAAEADLAATRLLVEAHAARAWFAAMALGAARGRAATVLDLAREREAMAQRCLARGLCALADVEVQTRARTEAEDRLALLARQEAEARNRLAYLAGDRTAPMPPMADLPAPVPIPAGLASDLVARRPDVAAAMARLDAADARQKAAKRDGLPRFGLTAAGGSASAALTGLLAAGAGSFGLGLLAALPVFDGGRHKARMAGAAAARDLAAVQLRDTLLTAWRETGDALALASQAGSALEAQTIRSQAAQTEAARTQRALDRGTASRAGAIASEIAGLEADNARTLRQLDALDARITLVAALGGGWPG